MRNDDSIRRQGSRYRVTVSDGSGGYLRVSYADRKLAELMRSRWIRAGANVTLVEVNNGYPNGR